MLAPIESWSSSTHHWKENIGNATINNCIKSFQFHIGTLSSVELRRKCYICLQQI